MFIHHPDAKWSLILSNRCVKTRRQQSSDMRRYLSSVRKSSPLQISSKYFFKDLATQAMDNMRTSD